MFIEGKQIFLRGLEQQDINPAYVHWLNDPEINVFMATRRFPNTLESLRVYYDKVKEDGRGIYLAICLKENGRHVGNVKLDKIDWINRTAEFGLLIGDKDYWGNGLGSEATYLISKQGFWQLNLNRITILSAADNLGALRCYTNAGYQQEGVLKKAVFLNGEYRDVAVLGQIKAEFQLRSVYEPRKNLHHCRGRGQS